MMPSSYSFKICSEKTGFEVKPRKKLDLDLMMRLKELADVTGFSIRVSVPALLLFQGKKGEVIHIFPSGRMLLRNFGSKSEAEVMAEKLAKLLYDMESQLAQRSD